MVAERGGEEEGELACGYTGREIRSLEIILFHEKCVCIFTSNNAAIECLAIFHDDSFLYPLPRVPGLDVCTSAIPTPSQYYGRNIEWVVILLREILGNVIAQVCGVLPKLKALLYILKVFIA